MLPKTSDEVSISNKSYGVAVTLCGIFGTLGVHHFYIGNWLHGVIDLALFIAFIILIINGPLALSLLFLGIDVVHTLFVFYKLIIGNQHDGHGRLITWKVNN
jgi:hypothetical protein